MTLLILFHQSHYRNLKHFYLDYVAKHLQKEFPRLVSYCQFVRLQQSVLVFLCAYLNARKGRITGISYIDSTSLSVCHNRHRVFEGYAKRGHTSMGWFYGFKLHLTVNEYGELLSFFVTPGNVDDRQPVPHLVKSFWGKLFGDRGYLSQSLTSQLLEQGLLLFTTIKRNMKNKLIHLTDKVLLRKRFIIETINDQLKNISQIEHSRHRSVFNFMVNVIAGLIAYSWQPKKPSLNLHSKELALLTHP